MEAGLESKANTLKALANAKRLKIAFLLYESPRSFSEIARLCGFRSSGELAFHLGMMKSVVRKRVDGRYELTEAGRLLVELVQGLSPSETRVERVPAGLLDLMIATAAIIVYGYSLLVALSSDPTVLSLVVSNGVVVGTLLLMYKFRYTLMEKYPYIITLPAFSYLIMAPSLSPRERGYAINGIFRASLISALLMSLISTLEVGLGDLPRFLTVAVAVILTGILILYYKFLYEKLKENIGRSLNA